MQTDETRDRQAALERLMAQYGTALLRYYQGMKVNDVAPVSYTHLDVYKRQPCRQWAWCM